MGMITEGSIWATGIRFQTIQELQMNQCANSHATARIAGIVIDEEAREYYRGAHENERIDIKTKVEGTERILFSGVIHNVTLDTKDQCSVIILELVSLSCLLDITKEDHTYQQIGKSISEIMRQAMNGRGELYYHGKDQPSEAMIVQYHETTWEFLLRMAALCGEPVFPSLNDPRLGVTIGIMNSPNQKGRLTQAGETSGYESSSLVIAGIKTGDGIVSKATAKLRKRELISTYQCSAKEAMIPVQTNQPVYVGKVVNGIVKAVDIDKVQVHITDIDSEYDGGGNTWFPYSTAYSSSVNEAGIYCMPLVGDPVRVFLPSKDLKDAFAASSVTVRVTSSIPENKIFVSPYGMSVLFTKDGMRIAVEGGEIYISLFKDGGISLVSNKSIGILSKGNINTTAGEGTILLRSDKEINIATDNSKICLINENSDRMYMVGPQVFIK